MFALLFLFFDMIIKLKNIFIKSNHTGGGTQGAAVLCTRCKITSPVLDVGFVVVNISHLHFNTHCTDTVNCIVSVCSYLSFLLSNHESSPGSKYSGNKSDTFSNVLVPSHEKSTFTVVLNNGSHTIPGNVQCPQNFGL